MFHRSSLSGEFFEGLVAIDEAIVEAAAAEPCSGCGGPLHRGDYPRKPRGGRWCRRRVVRSPLQPLLRSRGMPQSGDAAVGSLPGPASVRRGGGHRGQRRGPRDDGGERGRTGDRGSGPDDASVAALVAGTVHRDEPPSWSSRRRLVPAPERRRAAHFAARATRRRSAPARHEALGVARPDHHDQLPDGRDG